MKHLYLCVVLLILLASPAWAATTRYVDLVAGACSTYTPSTRLCGSGSALSYATIATGRAAMVAGDTLYLRTGTYTESDPLYLVSKTGSPGLEYTISGYQSEVATLAPSGGSRVIVVSSASYIVLTKMVIDGVNSTPAPSALGLNKIEYSNHITLTNNVIKRWKHNGIYVLASDFVTITNNTISDSYTPGCGPRPYGIYYETGNNSVIANNDIYGSGGGGMQIYPGPLTNITIKKNLVHGNNLCDSSSVGGILVGTEPPKTFTGGIITQNVIYGNVSPGVNHSAPGIKVFKGITGTKIYNNTIYNNDGYGIQFVDGTTPPSSTEIKNNINTGNFSGSVSSGGTGNTSSYNACLTGENCSNTGNKLTISALTSCTVSTSIFTQKSGSSCINQGTPLAGFLYNGSAPDIGAFETVSHSTCVVDNGEANTLKITFSNDVAPPLLPATGMTGFTARKSTANDVITATTRIGDNQIFLTLTTAIVFGDTVDYSYTPGNVTDSMLMGNTTNQPLLNTIGTNQACTNNVGAPATAAFTQAAFEFHGLRGTEAAPVGTPYATAPENTNILVHVGGAVRLRISVTCTAADCQPTGFFPRYSKNGGAYTNVVPDIFGADGIAFLGTGPDPDIPTNGTATTDQLSTSGTFVAGALVRTSNAIPTVDLAQNGKTELEYIFTWGPTAAANTTYDVRLYKQDGTPLDAYTVTPRITMMPCGMMMGY